MWMGKFFELVRMRRNVWLPIEKLRQIQQTKLGSLIHHAYKNVPYYRRLFDSVSIKPEDIKVPEDLLKVPITDRSMFKKSPDEFLAKGVDKSRCIIEYTSGSSGTPTYIYYRPEDRYHNLIRQVRILFENGYSPRYKTIGIWDADEYEMTKRQVIQRLGFFDRHLIPARLPLEQKMERLRKIEPEVLYSARSVLKLIASVLLREGVKPKNLKILNSTGEVLDSGTRDLLARAFGVVPFDVYGAEEVGNIAWECSQHRGLHINLDCVIVEIIKDGKPVAPGEEGNVVCTNLHAFATPFIRYDLGDRGVASDRTCPCGRGFPLLERIKGRSEDVIVLSNGKLLDWFFFYDFMLWYKDIDEYQIIQESESSIQVVLASSESAFQAAVARFKKDFQGVFPPDVRLEFKRVDRIPHTNSGKLKSIVSKLRPSF